MLKILKSHAYLVLVQMGYFITVMYVLLNNRDNMTITLEDMMEISFLKQLGLNELKRISVVIAVSALFLTIIYYILSKALKEQKIVSKKMPLHISGYIISLIMSFILWVPLILMFAASIGIICIPSVLIAVPLLSYGKEYLFIPAIILWIITLILMAFIFFLYSLYLTCWSPSIFISGKNLFAAYGKASKMVNKYYWRLLLAAFFIVVNMTIWLGTIIYGFMLLSEQVSLLSHPIVWINAGITAVLGIVIKTYLVVFLEKCYTENENTKESEEIAVANV